MKSAFEQGEQLRWYLHPFSFALSSLTASWEAAPGKHIARRWEQHGKPAVPRCLLVNPWGEGVGRVAVRTEEWSWLDGTEPEVCLVQGHAKAW